jgi:hypothetical protein
MVAPGTSCLHHTRDEPSCRSCRIIPAEGDRVLFLATDKCPDCPCAFAFGTKYICVCSVQRERHWPTKSDTSQNSP